MLLFDGHSLSTLVSRKLVPVDPRINMQGLGTADLRTKILDFRGFDSSIILISRGGIPIP